MATNLVTYTQDHVLKAAREGDVALADFDDGMNKASANSPGIGVHTAITDSKLSDWTVEDQHEVARRPQESQHLGDATGVAGNVYYPLKVIRDADLNDTISFVVAAAQATDGQGVLAGNTGPINRTGRTVEIGERVWGTDTVA